MNKDLHEEAGLVKAGLNDDGEQLWIGTEAQWKLYEQMVAGEAMAKENETQGI